MYRLRLRHTTSVRVVWVAAPQVSGEVSLQLAGPGAEPTLQVFLSVLLTTSCCPARKHKHADVHLHIHKLLHEACKYTHIQTDRDGNGEQSKSREVGVGEREGEGAFAALGGTSASLFLTLCTVSNSHSQYTLYCALRLSSRGTRQASTKVSIQRLYTPNINNKGCTHNHLSLWSYDCACLRGQEQLSATDVSIQKRKARLGIVTAPRNKMSKESNDWHPSIFGNKLMAALVTLKTMADQQSAWASSLKVVLVVV